MPRQLPWRQLNWIDPPLENDYEDDDVNGFGWEQVEELENGNRNDFEEREDPNGAAEPNLLGPAEARRQYNERRHAAQALAGGNNIPLPARALSPPGLTYDSDDGFDPLPSQPPQAIDPANPSLTGNPPPPLPPQRIDPANPSLTGPPPPPPPHQRINPANLLFAEPRPPPAYRKSSATTYEERIAVKALRHIAKMSYEDIAAALHITMRQAQYAASGPTKPQFTEKCGRKPKGVRKNQAGG